MHKRRQKDIGEWSKSIVPLEILALGLSNPYKWPFDTLKMFDKQVNTALGA